MNLRKALRVSLSADAQYGVFSCLSLSDKGDQLTHTAILVSASHWAVSPETPQRWAVCTAGHDITAKEGKVPYSYTRIFQILSFLPLKASAWGFCLILGLGTAYQETCVHFEALPTWCHARPGWQREGWFSSYVSHKNPRRPGL